MALFSQTQDLIAPFTFPLMSFAILKEFIAENELNLPIWRYISLDKFERILKDSALYFATAEQFSTNDLFEGAITEKEYLKRRANIERFEKDPALINHQLRDLENAFIPLQKYAKISC